MPPEVWGCLDTVREGGALPVLPCESRDLTDQRIFEIIPTDSCEVHLLVLNLDGAGYKQHLKLLLREYPAFFFFIKKKQMLGV